VRRQAGRGQGGPRVGGRQKRGCKEGLKEAFAADIVAGIDHTGPTLPCPCGQAARYAGLEAGCKVAIGTRLKRAGMHWTVAGADAIIALRCCKLSGRFEDFWERRSATAAAGAR